MSIEFKKSNINNISRYVNLYRKCFKNYPIKKNERYFQWLYSKNPIGNFIGIDAIENNLEIGQVGGIPYEFNYKGKKVMTYTMVRKTKLVPPTTSYLNIIKQGYKDCKLNIKSLQVALQPLVHLER